MCGIVGVIAARAGRLPRPEVAEAMCHAIAHRGPDDQGIHYSERAFIGMRRLSIIDLDGGHQPIHNEDQTVWVVFNGEIYNFRELRRELESLGHRFATNSDTECIVHAYEEYGEECFGRLRGMFAIAILDTRQQKLVLGRDRLGKKPLYYTERDGTLAFASELKSLLVLPEFDRRISAGAMQDYLILGYVPTPQAVFETTHKLPPAHYLVFRDGSVTIRRYWELAFEPKLPGSETELAEELRQRLEDAVRVRLVSDVPFGAFLSGGMDSSLVTALMARNLGAPVKTFTIGFKEAAFDETADARLVARHVGAEHHELVVEADAVGLMDELVWYLDEPFGDSSAIPTYLVARLAAQHVKMVLSGDGGDELFAGYERYRKYQSLDRLSRVPFNLAARCLCTAGRMLPAGLGVRLQRIGARLRMPFPERYLTGVATSPAETANALLARDYGARDLFAGVRTAYERTDIAPGLERLLAGDIATYLLDDILVKVDRMTMANSLEARAPLLDHELVEFAARLPLHLKYRGGAGKHLLRHVARDLLPPSTLRKRKQGFGIPLARWFRHDLKELAQDLFASRSFRERGIFDATAVRRCLEQHLAARHDHSEQLWLLLSFELWARRFLDAHSPGSARPSVASRSARALPASAQAVGAPCRGGTA
jgi:asparagine synthase (glutamine-hydrolysing)